MDESQEVPFRILEDRSGHAVPWYMLRYDANGTCLAPRSAAQVLAAVSTQTYSDIFLFCHGWNNDWPAALARYTSFIDGVSGFPRGASIGRAFEPLLVGLTWPSTALTFWDERGPAIAGEADASGGVDLSAIPTSERALVMEALRAAAGIPLEHARRLAQSLARIVPALGGDDEAVHQQAATSVDVLSAWAALASPDNGAGMLSSSTAFGIAENPHVALRAAGALPSMLDPRHLVRLLTVWQMKDRAAVVGRTGVATLVGSLLDASSAHLHLVGHSFGAKLLLSAVEATAAGRPISSLLLLQAAVSCQCFAAGLPGSGEPGGYRSVLGQVRSPLVATFSPHDRVLGWAYPIALRRTRDAGEVQAAGPAGPHEALGARGPAGCSFVSITMPVPPERYPPLEHMGALLALDGTRTIDGHGSVSNEACWWAMVELVRTAADRGVQ